MEKRYKETEKFRYLILAVQRQGNKILKSYLKDIGITPSQAEVISILKNKQPITLKDLGHLLICEDSSPSRLVERMVKDRLIERVKDENDSRFVRLALTPLGDEKYTLIMRAEADMYKVLEQLYTIAEFEETNKMLGKLLLNTSLEQTMIDRGFWED
ncbi:MarR family winged helix-turn-helix transcriptional regulator [Heyndrickxia sp. NPDC080065]|uniref:MarR family winged helix-turn-helix transcriptional regulator n=1 Tax=Heyndrickxia sp. NPDC080065 TaxID=3390568 RepID=UPI003D069550